MDQSKSHSQYIKEDADHHPEHSSWMKQALALAQEAVKLDETPVGALIVKDGRIIGRGFNLREQEQDVTMHAEMIAIREASRELGTWRLENCTLYVTMEPCVMCAGAIVQARIEQIVFGAVDLKAGAAGSIVDIFALRQNHQVAVTGGIEAEACSRVIKDYFQDLRKRDKQAGSRSERRRRAISENEKSDLGSK